MQYQATLAIARYATAPSLRMLMYAIDKAGHESGSSMGTHEYTRGNTRG